MSEVCAETGKEQLTQRDAERIAKEMRRRHRGDDPTSPYRCRFCGRWHVGRRDPLRRRSRRGRRRI